VKLRSVVFWLHLVTGCLAGAVILTMSVTGTVLAYRGEVTAWAERGSRVAPSGLPRLPVESLLHTLPPLVDGAALSTVTESADPELPVVLGFGRERVLLVDPYSGNALGAGAERTRAFFRLVEGIHRRLGVSGEHRAWGEAVTGACTLAFLGLIVSGLGLWWPRRWNREAVRRRLLFDRGLVGRARHLNWHQAIGFWSAAPLLLIVLSGVVMAYPWANNVLYRLADGRPAPSPQGADVGRRQANGAFEPDGLNALWTRAESQFPDWRTLTLRVPGGRNGPVTFVVDQGRGGRPDLRTQLVLDRKSAEVVRVEPFSSGSLGRRLRTWARWMHTGEAGGLAGQGLAALVSLNGALLVGTGLSLAWRRLRSWTARRPSARSQESPDTVSSPRSDRAQGSNGVLEEVP
jgi:uncharacterized iron-regulated membrane protein